MAPECRNEAYQDGPIQHPVLYLSAPHMYATIVQALELSEGMSFLNIGSGSGYLSHIVARIAGPSINHGIEQRREAVEFAMSRCAVIPEFRDLNYIRFRCGDAFAISAKGNLKYDRIYVGAGIQSSHSVVFRELLAPGGMMVAPRDGELVVITRVSEDTFVTRVLASVKFQPLVEPEARALRLKGKLSLAQPNDERIGFVSSQCISTARTVRM